jgi:hypothetical protein
MADKGPIVFIISHNRPIYLWVTLDSLYRKTVGNCRFILIDNKSTDTLIYDVINSFSNRGMFHKKYLMEENDVNNLRKVFKEQDDIGDYHFLIESDVEVLTHNWNNIMYKYFTSDNYGFLGSAVDKSDFVDLSGDEKNGNNIFLTKTESPERSYPLDGEGVIDVIPPGRLTIRKTQVVRDSIDTIHRDSQLTQFTKDAGYMTGLIRDVKHRHLSLLNYYDYNGYSQNERDNFFNN